jgi:hypothetical protein
LDVILGGDLSSVIEGLLDYERQDLRNSFGTIE